MSPHLTRNCCFAVPACTREEHPSYIHCGCPLTFIENLVFNPLAFQLCQRILIHGSICHSEVTLYEVLVKDSLNIQYIHEFPFSHSFADVTRIATHLVTHFSPTEAVLGLCPLCGGSQSFRSSICLHFCTLSALSCLPAHGKQNTATLKCTIHDGHKQVATPSTWGCQNTVQWPRPFSLDPTSATDAASTVSTGPAKRKKCVHQGKNSGFYLACH